MLPRFGLAPLGWTLNVLSARLVPFRGQTTFFFLFLHLGRRVAPRLMWAAHPGSPAGGYCFCLLHISCGDVLGLVRHELQFFLGQLVGFSG